MSAFPSQDTGRHAHFAFPVVPRYAEIDQQGVVFNAHYLTWFDEAFTGFLDHLGVAYPDLVAAGVDVQVVHTELDYAAPVRWRDEVAVGVTCERVGTTSFVLRFEVATTRSGATSVAVTGRTVYVCVDPTTWTKRDVPELLASALGRSA